MASERFDVVVVGGGFAGIAAALAASRVGARTLLAERCGELGGNVSQALVHTICGLYLSANDRPPQLAHPGFPARFTAALQQAGAAGEPERVGRVWVLPTDPLHCSAVARSLCELEAGLELRTGVELVTATLARCGREPQRLSLCTPQNATSQVEAAVIVDASGDAVVAQLGAAEVEIAEPALLQLPSYIFRLAGVDTAAMDELQGFARVRVTHAVASGVRDGALPAGCEAVLVRPGAEPGQVYVTLNIPRPVDLAYAPLDPACLKTLQAQASDAALRAVAYLRRTRAPFEKCRIDLRPQCLGVRETRRIVGCCRISREHLLEGRRVADEVAISTWPVELWQDHRRAKFEHPVGPSSVPLGALLSRSHAGLAMAGRCLSADRQALGALRVLGTALATGEAAGVAAALAADAREPLHGLAPSRVRAHILGHAG